MWNVRIQNDYCELIALKKINTNLTWITKKRTYNLNNYSITYNNDKFYPQQMFIPQKQIKCKIIFDLYNKCIYIT